MQLVSHIRFIHDTIQSTNINIEKLIASTCRALASYNNLTSEEISFNSICTIINDSTLLCYNSQKFIF